jgi:hypothetical protein
MYVAIHPVFRGRNGVFALLSILLYLAMAMHNTLPRPILWTLYLSFVPNLYGSILIGILGRNNKYNDASPRSRKSLVNVVACRIRGDKLAIFDCCMLSV